MCTFTKVCLVFPSCQASSVLVTQYGESELTLTEYTLKENCVRVKDASFDLGLSWFPTLVFPRAMMFSLRESLRLCKHLLHEKLRELR